MERLLKEPPPKSIRDHLSALTDTQRRVVTLRWGYRWSVARIARAMERDRKTISETLNRAESKMGRQGKGQKKSTARAVAFSEASHIEDALIDKIDREKAECVPQRRFWASNGP